MKGFLISDFSIDTKLLKSIAHSMNCELIDIYSISNNLSIFETIKIKIKNSDFVIAILDKYNVNLALEIGIAIGLGKPILFFLSDSKVDIPFSLTEYQIVRLSLNDSKFINISLKIFFEDLYKKRYKVYKSTNIKNEITISNNELDIKTLLNEITLLRKKGNGISFERLVENILSHSNVNYQSQSNGGKDDSVDFVFWVKELDGILSNPIFIELKIGKISQHTLANGIYQLQKVIQTASTGTGLLLYLDRDNKRLNSILSGNSNIFFSDFEDFILKVNDSGIARAIIEIRNASVHGRNTNG